MIFTKSVLILSAVVLEREYRINTITKNLIGEKMRAQRKAVKHKIDERRRTKHDNRDRGKDKLDGKPP